VRSNDCSVQDVIGFVVVVAQNIRLHKCGIDVALMWHKDDTELKPIQHSIFVAVAGLVVAGSSSSILDPTNRMTTSRSRLDGDDSR